MSRPHLASETITVHVPFRVVKQGGRKEMQMPAGAALQLKTDSALVKALARAFRWKRMLDTGEFTTIAELAAHDGIACSYMTRVLRLTLLAPDIVEAILDGKQGLGVPLARLLEPFPVEWEWQHHDSLDQREWPYAVSQANGRSRRTGRSHRTQRETDPSPKPPVVKARHETELST